ncbi:hypothetical protein SLS55_007068 [Diplodia seriata]|uniref:Myb-like domain-containing protein n=1 Tax=Diplodia seriata TaxID=420778 RepID=A0ABR3CB78_9PEZI
MATNTKFSLDAITSLTEAEKTRLIAVFLCHNDRNNVDWDAATALMGAKTKHSFKVTYYNTMKKVGSGGDGSGGGSKAATPKRKRAAGGEDTPTPTSKKRGRGKKAIKTEEEEIELQPDSDQVADDTASGEEAELDLRSFFDTEEI